MAITSGKKINSTDLYGTLNVLSRRFFATGAANLFPAAN
jgi:hypothetical protein